MQGYIQVYTGNGKGKTTAALGLVLRAAGAGLKIFIAQFMKLGKYSEIKTLEKMENIKLKQYGRENMICGKPSVEDIKTAEDGWDDLLKKIDNNNYDILILDEVNVAIKYKLLPLDKVINFLKNKPSGLEVILTGRNAPAEIIELADIVTEMKEIKHYYEKGVSARQGIEN